MNAVGSIRIGLAIPEQVVEAIAKRIDADTSTEDGRVAALEALESDIEDSPVDFLDYGTSTEVEVDG